MLNIFLGSEAAFSAPHLMNIITARYDLWAPAENSTPRSGLELHFRNKCRVD